MDVLLSKSTVQESPKPLQVSGLLFRVRVQGLLRVLGIWGGLRVRAFTGTGSIPRGVLLGLLAFIPLYYAPV